MMENDTKSFGDNNAVILNSSVPELRQKKKHHVIHYNYVQEALNSRIALISNVDTGYNLSDPFTKLLDKLKRKENIHHVLF